MTYSRVFAASVVALGLCGASAHAAAVDLTNWIENGKTGNGAGTWTVSAAKDSVFQSINGQPTVFFDPGNDAQGNQLGGTIKVETTGDDDYIGFVLGFDANEFGSTNADFWLIDWKQGAQSGSPGAGLRLSHVTGNVGAASTNDFWAHNGTVSIVQTAANLGGTGWADNTEYSFDLEFTKDLIEVKVDGVTELTYTSTDHGAQFEDGAFGFYNYSQSSVRYAGITQVQAPSEVPVPMALPLMASGLGALGFLGMRRRKG
ncbi:PEP-CTERM sorting domain-containing protein [Meridianimarinicoccus aquatilis]|uniref:PEP-CTERM sorting domain-containing protein n=1 Tax=Meridianimarinicoccus aquatilis TaxID=2552766 RepID=A0A4R6AVU8_9RHOB|nr:PEP-CTERM sorting domain-containing protein [Fluviibacterium aquatile]QIE42495.1 PEP-CTERM sorting domain-containing protein [Rhodobacteraceae bacterium SC52]TDL86928.1 PEP-CTERM sorting domain-containing protein [Fluviibacterium aquatile]